ncbi:MAG TPA: SagB/ThcOx family dehydrogenase [Candidatus Paceibacterota bacterium]|nr:SagB/ThcOx family dehydrogenase [Verrucomicrobiota bacterium]HRY48353.1 SagB/ThcOx family dehydrogenase [Candidatus Paceibacterota bacterium]HSA01314.1 SagB/ThcOx family dehydrogenase [Candidatus Paceibacterota bacterium]
MTDAVFEYHEVTKHYFDHYAPGPGGLDWANQPDPFRRYVGAPLCLLERIPPAPVSGPAGAVQECDLRSVSQLLFDAFALSAWKQAGTSRWALRVNPSSGNLHPTEAYLIAGKIPGLSDGPAVYHYAPREHGLELRARFPGSLWDRMGEAWGGSGLLVGLSSVVWRETWKYGARAFRYCNHDVGHALAALTIAALGLGWRVRLCEAISSSDLYAILGLNRPLASEPEHPDCLVVITPPGERPADSEDWASVARLFEQLEWIGKPNRLSPQSVEWPQIKRVMAACRKPGIAPPVLQRAGCQQSEFVPLSGRTLRRKWIHQRRSAVAMDDQTHLPAVSFFQMLEALLPRHPPFDTWPWAPAVSLILFVHRVAALAPGLYGLIRHPDHETAWRSLWPSEWTWSRIEGTPRDVVLYRWIEADMRHAARTISCHQDIAGDGCFSLGMVTEFESVIEKHGGWFYPRLFWECGMIGQVLYLEAEQAGVRGTGIGCFFDDAVHEILGLKSRRFQSLYHFTVGGAMEDPRLTTWPPYPPLDNLESSRF